ncbi:methionine biosynthesis protein MetW [Neisseria zalophi]|uniref:Methionine biosynthesis protein MetW n=1 Tax=Neisseria zalophi TaxID=640030 RepID=A0A5J6PUS7_9NEIS|nr:methionine biosynthesis protein MetW [Neisseria zalophi]QEY26411.1 methionine biosynthesis protein MetW [Neisseria zalophi]
MTQLRDDLQLIYDWIPSGSRVLDLGCGDGELLSALIKRKNCSGYGIEIDTDSVIAAIERGVNVIQSDLEQGLQDFDDNSFDILVLSQTIQAMQNTETILRDLTRVAKQAIVSFPNFGYWRNRLQIALLGHMPVSERMPYQWYNTPNIHWCTLQDFDRLCENNQIRVLERTVMTAGKQVNLLPNILGSLAFYRIG